MIKKKIAIIKRDGSKKSVAMEIEGMQRELRSSCYKKDSEHQILLLIKATVKQGYLTRIQEYLTPQNRKPFGLITLKLLVI